MTDTNPNQICYLCEKKWEDHFFSTRQCRTHGEDIFSARRELPVTTCVESGCVEKWGGLHCSKCAENHGILGECCWKKNIDLLTSENVGLREHIIECEKVIEAARAGARYSQEPEELWQALKRYDAIPTWGRK